MFDVHSLLFIFPHSAFKALVPLAAEFIFASKPSTVHPAQKQVNAYGS